MSIRCPTAELWATRRYSFNSAERGEEISFSNRRLVEESVYLNGFGILFRSNCRRV
jgi:hypothetical protein